MAQIDFRFAPEGEFYFDVQTIEGKHGLSPWTLSVVARAIGDLVATIDQSIAGDFDLEVTIEEIIPGSSRIRGKAKKKSGKLDLKGDLRAIIQQVIAALIVLAIAQCMSKQGVEVHIHEDNDKYTVITGDTEIILPKEAAEFSENLKSEDVRLSVANLYRRLASDDDVIELRVPADFRPTSPSLSVPKARLADYSSILRPDDKVALSLRETRTRRYDQQEVVLVRAIFESAHRRWEFSWNGHRIAATMNDKEFVRRLMNKEIALRAFDTFVVDLTVDEMFEPLTGAWIIDTAAVTRVYDVTTGPVQQDFFR